MNLATLARFSSGLIIAVSAGTLCAFALGVHVRLPFLPPWSCLAFLVAGCVLWSNGRLWPLSVAILIIGIVTGLESLIGVDTGFDSLLFPKGILKDVRHPGRPASLTSFELIVIGAACLFLPVRRTWAVVLREFSAVVTLSLAYLSFLEYLRVGVSRDGTMSPVATALTILSSFAILIVAPEQRLLPLLRDPSPAGILVRGLMPVPFVLTFVTTLVRIALEHWHGYNPQIGAAALAACNLLAALAIVWACSTSVRNFDLARHRAEDELRQQQANALLGSIVQACPLAVCALDLDGGLRKSNAAADDIGLWAIPECRRLAQRALDGERITGVEVTVSAQGREQYLTVWASPLPGPGGATDGAVIIAVDTSERRAIDEQIQQTQRLESLGVLAGGIAHDFNNLLTGVMGHASLLHEHVASGSHAAVSVDALIAAADHMAKLTAQMLAYSGKGRFVLEPLNLSREVASIAGLLQSSISRNVQLHLHLADALPSITADAGQVQQVITNLVLNAAEAIPQDNGWVEVSTDIRSVDAAELERSVARPPAPPGDYVVLTVRDNGTGIDDETKARIFEPFFTTKFPGRGLGLSAVLGIMGSHHGALTFETRPASGSVFRAYFPVTLTPTPPRDTVTSCAP